MPTCFTRPISLSCQPEGLENARYILVAQNLDRKRGHVAAVVEKEAVPDLLDEDEALNSGRELRVFFDCLVGKDGYQPAETPVAGVHRSVARSAGSCKKGSSCAGISAGKRVDRTNHGEWDRTGIAGLETHQISINCFRVGIGGLEQRACKHESGAAVVDRMQEVVLLAAPKRRAERGPRERCAWHHLTRGRRRGEMAGGAGKYVQRG